MRSLLTIFFLAILLQACPGQEAEPMAAVVQEDSIPAVEPEVLQLDSSFYHLNADTTLAYSIRLLTHREIEQKWKGHYLSAKTDSAKEAVLLKMGKQLEGLLVNGVFPFWYGTEWDFNGISNKPGEGQIACGYFVSTTLKHIGFNLNRYKLAQQASQKACEVLACGDTVRRYTPADIAEFIAKTAALPDALYCVGLDYHVGYVLKRKGEWFFIHSSFLSPGTVVLERIENSAAFYSQTYFLTNLSQNPRLLKKWLLEEEIVVS
ncbi:MAG: hypothetical protein EP332_09815 [Bacteroidetes bacterium]|nr:MAG: hypothetical protein EP332_09815 [Bacteroidota bacterium]